MSRIEELIKQKCPDGVEYFPLLTVANVLYGYPCDASLFNTKSDGKPLARIRDVLSGVSDTYTTENVPERYELAKGDLLVGMDGNFHVANWKTDGGILCQRVCKVYSVDVENTITNGYLSHILGPIIKKIEEGKPSGTVKHLLDKDIKAIEIPVPPIEVQQEIVRILDKFTALEAGLQAELDVRKRQFEYYKENLISNAEDAEIKTIEEIATEIYRGAGIKRDETTPTGIPCVRYGEIYTSYNISFDKCISYTTENVIASPKYFEHGNILFAITGESVEDIAKSIAYLGHDKCMCGGDIVVMKHNQEPRYISYALSTYDAIVQKGKGKVKSKVVHSSVPAIQKIKIPVPTLKEQNRIADKLDAFLTLIYDDEKGLPAEIEARHKQYEYYRDKLLTFERKVV